MKKAILCKTGEDYLLRDMNGDTLGITNGTINGRKLSKQNCDEIFGVVDDFDIAIGKAMNYGDTWNKPETLTDAQKGYLHGFADALEMNKDKLFTLEDMQKAFELGHNGAADTYMLEKNEQEFEKLIQQPTEIDVEIEMEDYARQLTSGGVEVMRIKLDEPIPKLDINGCLILRKITS